MPKKTDKAYMYVLTCSDGTLYTGYTTDLKKRLATHNQGKGAKYTKARLPVSLLYYEPFSSKQAAMKAEYHFKQQSRAQKLAYIKAHQNTLDH
ncbi:GIY-YIG nuclease family protein [Streptococcus sp. zg-JUN1979]|uniref:GIY-YIG nuclease family protein n=1 Tax=Streptococcus sp. zg-JUN1979 TaxID=3391450 RepID=UPI0039A56D36